MCAVRRLSINAVFSGEFSPHLHACGMGIVHAAPRGHNKTAPLADYVNELAAVLLNLLWRSRLQQGKWHISGDAGRLPHDLLGPDKVRGIEVHYDFP